MVAARASIAARKARVPLRWPEVAGFADATATSRISKLQVCLPQSIEQELVAREIMSVEEANATLATD